MLIRENVIEKVYMTSDYESVVADEVLDLNGYLIMPGMVNTHHQICQNLIKVMVIDDELYCWLNTLYPVWEILDDETIYTSSRQAMAELLLSGCTTSSDHLYMLPNNTRLDTQIKAAQEMGIPFHAAGEAMSRGQSEEGLLPDNYVGKEENILKKMN